MVDPTGSSSAPYSLHSRSSVNWRNATVPWWKNRMPSKENRTATAEEATSSDEGMDNRSVHQIDYYNL